MAADDSDPLDELIEQNKKKEEKLQETLRGNGSESEVSVSASQTETSQTVGRMIEGMLGGLSVEQKLALGAAGVIVLASMSGGDEGGSERDSSQVDCPECGSSKSKRGMDGHLRWGHDLDGDELQEARQKAGIGG
jgi:hypothetical protein